MEEKIRISCVGDCVLDEPGPIDPYFDAARDYLKAQDVMIGHVETPHTDRNMPSCIDIQAPPSKPEHLEAMARAGFHVGTMAGNHLYDCGPLGVIDTAEKLKAIGMLPVGGGANIDEAKKPAIVEKNGIKVGILSYNLAGPKLGWAMSQKPGANYVPVETAYVPNRDMPGSPCRIYTFVWPENMEKLKAEVKALKEQVDIAVVVYHKGNGGNNTRLDYYEQPVCYAAIDAGADIVFAHHHHLLKGIEMYKGHPIYHGLGNFVTVTYAMTAGHNDTPEMVAYLKQRAKEGRGNGHYRVDCYPWGDESRYTMVATVEVDKNGVVQPGFLPCYIEDSCVVVPKTRENGGKEVLDFVEKQTEGAKLDARFEWSEDGKYVYIYHK